MKSPQKLSFLAALLLTVGAYTASAQTVFNEIEGNDSKLTANPVVLTGVGDSIVGASTGSSTTVAGPTSADYYLVTTPVQPVAIYVNRLTITSPTAGYVGTIRGLGQVPTNTGNNVGPGLPNAGSTDVAVQTSPTVPGRINQWYSFGGTGSIYYRVTGTAATTSNYTATFTQTQVTPVNLGTFAAGSITLTNTGRTSTQDTDLIVYNSQLQPIPGFLNDDFLDGTTVPAGGSTLNSLLTRTYAPGTYYVAISNFNVADNQLSPADEGTANANVLDFAGAMANSSTTTFGAIPFRITDANGSTDFDATKAGAFDIYWGTFTVVPEPGSVALALVGAAGLGLAACRRRLARR